MRKGAIFVIYGLVFLFFLFRMFYYREALGYVPNEEAHISYLVYIEENPGKLIPKWEEMGLCEERTELEDGICQYVIKDRVCNIKNPPLYYMFLHLVSGIVTEKSEEGHFVYVDQDRLKTVNLYLTGLVMLLILYIGCTRLGRLTSSCLVHGIYAVAASFLPMLAVFGSGITNNNLANLGVAIFMLGALRHYERKRGFFTYLLTAVGFFLSAMSSLMASGFVVVLLIGMILFDVVWNKGSNILLNYRFLVTAPVYLVAVIYFILLQIRFGSVQTDANRMAVLEAWRPKVGFFSDGWQGILLFVVVFATVLFVFVACIRGLFHGSSKEKRKSRYTALYASMVIGLVMITAITWIKEGFTLEEYIGGYQAGYYLCIVPFMALALAEGVCYMIKGEKNPLRGEAIGITVMLFFLLLVSGTGLEALAKGEKNIFDSIRLASLKHQLKGQGYQTEYVDSGSAPYGMELAGYLLDGFVVAQDFTVTEEMLEHEELTVEIKVSTYGRKNPVHLYVEIAQDNGYGKAYKIDCESLKNNQDVAITFETEGMQSGDCHIRLFSDASSGNQAVTVFTTQNCVLAPDMKVAGTQKKCNLVMAIFTPAEKKEK